MLLTLTHFNGKLNYRRECKNADNGNNIISELVKEENQTTISIRNNSMILEKYIGKKRAKSMVLLGFYQESISGIRISFIIYLYIQYVFSPRWLCNQWCILESTPSSTKIWLISKERSAWIQSQISLSHHALLTFPSFSSHLSPIPATPVPSPEASLWMTTSRSQELSLERWKSVWSRTLSNYMHDHSHW